MNQEYICRVAVETDYEQLEALEAALDSVHIQALPEIFQSYKGRSREKTFFFPKGTEDEAVTFVAENGQGLLGCLCLETRKSAPIALLVPRKFAVIDSLYVLPSARHNGIAKSLVAMADDWARLNGCSSLELNVYAFNQGALEFYRAVGFTDLSRKLTRSVE